MSWVEARRNFIPVRTEMNLFSEDHALAGQLDGLFYDTEAKQFVLVDWCALLRVSLHSRQ